MANLPPMSRGKEVYSKRSALNVTMRRWNDNVIKFLNFGGMIGGKSNQMRGEARIISKSLVINNVALRCPL